MKPKYNHEIKIEKASGLIVEMALCEVPHVFLRPGQLYRFIVIEGCKACEKAAKPYEQEII